MKSNPKKLSDFVNFWMPKAFIILLVFLSIPVIFGLQIYPLFHFWLSMQFNTALLIFLVSLSLIMDHGKSRRLELIFSAIIFTLGFLTLIEHFTVYDFGIDQLFKGRSHPVYSQYPGRMAFNSALAFSLIGLSFMINSLKMPNYFQQMLVGFMTSFPLALGSVTLVAPIFGSGPAVDLSSYVHMSIPTALGLFITGIELLRKTLLKLKASEENSFKIYPLLIITIVSFLTLFCWQFALKLESQKIQDSLSVLLEKKRDEIDEKLKETGLALVRYALRVEILGLGNQKYLEEDSLNYIKTIGVITRIGIVDKELKVIQSFPKDLHHQVKNFDQKSDPIRLQAFQQSIFSHQPVLSQSINLKSHGLGHIFPVAMFRDEQFFGAIYATIDIRNIFKDKFSTRDFSFLVKNKGVIQYEVKASSNLVDGLFTYVKLKKDFAEWELYLYPTLEFVKKHKTSVPLFILIVGEIFAILLSAIIFLTMQTAKLQQLFLEKETENLMRLNIALSSAKIAAWSIDLRSGKVWRSQNHHLIFGYTNIPSNWSLEIFYTHVLSEDCERLKNEFAVTKKTLEPSQMDIRIKRVDDQSVRWVRIVSRYVLNQLGLPYLRVGIIQDINDEKLAENARLTDLEWRKSILRSSNYFIISTDVKGVIQTFNETAERILGYKAVDVIGKFTPIILHDNDEVVERAKILSHELKMKVEPGFETLVAKAKILQTYDENEWTYITKDGIRIPVQLSVTPLYSIEKKIVGHLVTAMDLTEKKRAESKLKVAYDRLRLVVEATGEGIFERSLVTGEILFLNDQGKKIFGFNQEENPSVEEINSLVHSDDREIVWKSINANIQQETDHFELETRIYDRNHYGDEKWIRSRGHVVFKNGTADTIVVTFADVTAQVKARKLLEEALIASEAATKAKSAFLASMSHEIRTPLNGVLGMIDLLLETKLEIEQKSYALIAKQSGSNLLQLISDILDFSKIEAGKMELQLVSQNIAKIVENQVEIMAIKALEKKICLTSFISPEIPLNIMADQGRLGQIILNLLSNAIKFTQEGGVSIYVTKGENSLLRFEVRDTGIGISQENIAKLFQPFTQADSGISSKYGGTGLGLSISKKFVEMMDGHIGVESKTGKGSVFWFEIPYQVSSSTPDNDKRSGWEDLIGVRVLLVDNEGLNKKTLEEYLFSSKMRGFSVTSSAEAIKCIESAINQNDPYKLMILAEKVEEENAFEIYKKIVDQFQQEAPKSVYISNFSSRKEEREVIARGFSAVLYRPIKQSQYFNSLVTALRNASSIFSNEDSLLVSESQQDQEIKNKKRVLVAEDAPVNQLLTRKMLEILGHTVSVVANGIEVLLALNQAQYDLVLMDCQMPEMDGFEATKRIRQLSDESIRNIPIIALTANAMDGDAEKCLAIGMNDYLSKPMKKADLKTVIDKWT